MCKLLSCMEYYPVPQPCMDLTAIRYWEDQVQWSIFPVLGGYVKSGKNGEELIVNTCKGIIEGLTSHMGNSITTTTIVCLFRKTSDSVLYLYLLHKLENMGSRTNCCWELETFLLEDSSVATNRVYVWRVVLRIIPGLQLLMGHI